jgi:phosphohistidine phosphatase SixA
VLVIFITHAEAQWVDKPHFRALTDRGRAQVDETAARFRRIIPALAPDLVSKKVHVGEIISSPTARCVESALRFSDAIKDLTGTSDIRVHDNLGEQRSEDLSGKDLVSILNETVSQATLICTHADLAGALPASATLKPEYFHDKWFDVRPVLVLVEYERQSEWDSADVLSCEYPELTSWETLVTR